MRFEVKVPDDDDGYVLGTFEADALPRVGERFCFFGHAEVCRGANDTFVGIVDDVVWEATHHPRVGQVVVTVWLREEVSLVTIFCTCSKQELEVAFPPGHARAEDGFCLNCSKTVRTR